MTFGSTKPRPLWSPFLAVVVVATAVGGASCSGGSGGSHSASTTTTPPTVTPPTVAPPTVTPPTVTPPTVTRPTTPAGPVVAVPASIDPTGRADVTAALQRFLARVPSGRTIRFGHDARYRVDGTLFLRDRNRLTIDGNGATVFAQARGAPDRAQWWIKDGSRIVFRDLTVSGANPSAGSGEGAYVRKLETQHGFRFEGVNGAELSHVRVHDVFGDFVYIGRDVKRVISRNIWIHDSVFSRNGRQGISVTAGSNIVIERNRIGDTRRSTIDLEPNARSWHVSNVFVLNNTVGQGRLLFIASHGQGSVNSVVISGNQLIGHSLTIDAMAPENSRRSNWVVVDNTSNLAVHNRPMRFFRIDGLVVRGNQQVVTGNKPGVVLTGVCGAQVSGNEFGSGSANQSGSDRVRATTAQCDAPLVIPSVRAIPGRGGSGPVPTTTTTTTTSPGSSTSTPGSTSPVTTRPAPAPAPGTGGGFDLADLIFVVLGVAVLIAFVVAVIRRRR